MTYEKAIEDVRTQLYREGREHGAAEARDRGFGKASPGTLAGRFAERVAEGYAEEMLEYLEAVTVRLLKSEQAKSGAVTVEQIAEIVELPVEAVKAFAAKSGNE